MTNILQNLPMSSLGWVCCHAPRLGDALAEHSWISPMGVIKVCDSVLRGIAQVVFVNNPVSGLLILVGLFIADLITGLATLYCTLIALFVAKVIHDLPDSQVSAGLPLFSPVLVGSVIASLYTPFFNAPITPAVWGYMAIAAVFSVCVFAGLDHLLGSHNLPAYTLPFNIATSVVFLGMQGAGFGSHQMSPVDDSLLPAFDNVTFAIDWHKVWVGSVLSAGQVWAVESMACSILVLVGMMLCSPLLTAACFVGGTLGTFIGLVVSKPPFTLVYAGVWGYNGFLAAGAMVFFVVVSPRVILLAIINALLATFIQAALVPVFAQNNLPVFTFPFCLASLLLLAAVSSSSSFRRVASPSFPEMHLYSHHQESMAVQKQEGKEEDSTAHMV